VLAQTFGDFEIIIVNDGSTDELTNSILAAYSKPKTRVLHTNNQGLAAARNNGIRASSGTYILPLDADDYIGATYLEQAVAILNAQPDTGIVYCEAEFFGERTGKWNLEPYSLPRILLANMIFCSGFYRRADWEQTRGYNSSLSAWEDHDFWLSIIELGREVHRIPEVLFHYRRRAGSMVTAVGHDRSIEYLTIMFQNHQQLYAANMGFIFDEVYRLRQNVEYLKLINDSMENSSTWKLRNFCLSLKQRLGFAPRPERCES
jgi:glycosyltransferase involved in cell wall biosynthesis